MSNKGNVSLEDLEARCDMLTRRVNDRTRNQSVHNSPPRPTSSVSGYNASYSPVPNVSSSGLASLTPTHNDSSQHYQQQQVAVGGGGYAAQSPGSAPVATTTQQQVIRAVHQNAAANGLSFHEISATVAQLEREKERLQQQLEMTETHLRAYQQLQQMMIQHPSTASNTANVPQQQYQQIAGVPSASHAPVSPRRSHHAGTSPSPNRNVSPRRQFATPVAAPPVAAPSQVGTAASLQTDQIYEELRQIRQAREEREAQRRTQQH